MQCRAAAAAAITRNLSHFVRAILPDCGVLNVLRSMPEGVWLQKIVDFFALNNLSSADFETAFKGKRKYKIGTKLYQVERLLDKRKSLLIRRPDSWLIRTQLPEIKSLTRVM